MANARIQALLHPARQHGVGEHDLGGAFNVVHVHPATFALERCKLSQQQPGKARHSPVVLPGCVMGASRSYLQNCVLRFTNGGNAHNLVAKLAGCAFFSQQRKQH